MWSDSATSACRWRSSSASSFDTVGFDIKADRIAELEERQGQHARVLDRRAARRRASCKYSTSLKDLGKCRVFIITVPTPIDRYNRPDLTPLERSSETVGKVLKKGDVVVYESTVYPGCTEEVCIPILERESGLKFNKDFFAGYSPERINPGDKEHRLPIDQEGDFGFDTRSRGLRRQAVPLGGHAPARTRRRASASPRPPRSSRTRSAT